MYCCLDSFSCEKFGLAHESMASCLVYQNFKNFGDSTIVYCVGVYDYVPPEFAYMLIQCWIYVSILSASGMS